MDAWMHECMDHICICIWTSMFIFSLSLVKEALFLWKQSVHVYDMSCMPVRQDDLLLVLTYSC